MADVLVIAGTSDARRIISKLAELGVSMAATVTTSFGRELLSEYENLEIQEGKLDSHGMVLLIKQFYVKCLVDASHPFAREASLNAIKACEQAGIVYIRYERTGSAFEGQRVIRAGSYEEAAEKVSKLEGNILAAIGSNNLQILVSKIPDYKNRLFARVLPDSRIIAKCEELGLSAGNIIAVKGPFSEEMNIEMIKHCNAKAIITKDSGNEGGVLEKLGAAEKMGITAVVIDRPDVDYPVKISSVDEVARMVSELIFSEGR